MAVKKTAKQSDRGASQPEVPFGPNEFLRLDNEPAAKAMPSELAKEALSKRISIHLPGKEKTPKEITKLREIPNTFQIEVPGDAAVGLPGMKSGRMSVSEVTKGIKAQRSPAALSEPYKPDWLDYTPHAKVTTDERALMRRIDGRKVVPHYGVFGSDDRVVYYPSGYPWSCVGKILVWDDFSQPYPAWSGSGVLIGGRVVLTCGHMAPWGSRNWAMQFIPAFYDGGSTLGRGVSSWVSDYWGYNTNNQVSAWDMLVLRLYTPLGNTYGYFGTKDYHSSWEGGNYWTLAGYPGAVAGGNRPSRQMWWPVLDDDSDGSAEEVEYEADSSPGNSGGPVFGFWNGMPYAIATHSGGSKTTFLWWTLEDTNVGAGGGALNSLVAWARSNWP